jgi:hypothetical protein
VKTHQAAHRIATVCRVLGVSPSGYYAWQSRPRSARTQADAALTQQIGTIHARSRETYGAPRVHAELAAQGTLVGRKRVARLMQAAGLAGVSRRPFVTTTRRDPRARPAPDLVRRAFTADGPNRLRDGPMVRRRCLQPVDTRLQRRVGERLDLAPLQPGVPGSDDRGAHGPTADPQAPGHLAVTPAQDPFLAKDLSGMSHGQSLGGHSPLSGTNGSVRRPASLGSGHPPRRGCPTGGGDHDAPIRVITMPISVIMIDRSR